MRAAGRKLFSRETADREDSARITARDFGGKHIQRQETGKRSTQRNVHTVAELLKPMGITAGNIAATIVISETGSGGMKMEFRNKWFPSSQICNCCGTVHTEMKDLSIRTMRCDCGFVLDRDHNSALNIKNEGLRILKSAS